MRKRTGYRVRSFSYFESEGDADILVKPALLEDELWTLLRLKPFTLASAEVLVQPSVFYTRLKHKPVQPEKARISIEKGETESILNLVYTSIPRELGIRFETEFPHRILGWAETHEGELLSKGTLKKIMLDDYWKHHDNASAPLRAELNQDSSLVVNNPQGEIIFVPKPTSISARLQYQITLLQTQNPVCATRLPRHFLRRAYGPLYFCTAGCAKACSTSARAASLARPCPWYPSAIS